MLTLSHLVEGEEFLGLKGLLGTLRKEAVVDVMLGGKISPIQGFLCILLPCMAQTIWEVT